jgi:hypothetical protein
VRGVAWWDGVGNENVDSWFGYICYYTAIYSGFNVI